MSAYSDFQVTNRSDKKRSLGTPRNKLFQAPSCALPQHRPASFDGPARSCQVCYSVNHDISLVLNGRAINGNWGQMVMIRIDQVASLVGGALWETVVVRWALVSACSGYLRMEGSLSLLHSLRFY